MFCEALPSSPTLYSYDWGEVLAATPKTLPTRVNPLRAADYDLAALTIDLQATDEVLQRFMPVGGTAPAELYAYLSDASTTVQITPAGAIDEGFVWIGDECLKLSSKTTPGAYDQFTAVRGCAKTTAREHSAETAVWDRLPYLYGRIVRLYVMFDEGTPVELRLFKLSSHAINDSHTELSIRTQEFLKSVDNAELYRTNRRFRVGQSRVDVVGVGGYLRGTLPHPDENYVRMTPNGNDSVFLAFEFEDQKYVVRGRQVAAVTSGGNSIDMSDLIIIDDVVFDASAREIVATGLGQPLLHNARPITSIRRLPADVEFQEILYAYRNGEDPSSFDAIPNQWHAAAIIFSFLCSTGVGSNNPEDPDNPGSYLTYDILAADIGMGIPVGALDYPSFAAVITNHPGMKIDQFDSSGAKNALDNVESIARRFNLFLSPSREGKISLRVFETFSVNTATTLVDESLNGIALPVRDGEGPRLPINWDIARVSKLTAIVGESYFDEGKAIDVEIFNNRAEALMSSSSGDNYDYSTLRQVRWKRAAEDLLAKSALRSTPFPRLSGLFTREHAESVGGFTSGAFPGCGEFVRVLRGPLDEWTVIDPSGSRVAVNDDGQWLTYLGMVVSESLDLDEWTVQADIWLVNWGVQNMLRLIAPAVSVSAVGTDGGSGSPYVDRSTKWPSVDGNTGFWDPIDTRQDEVELWRSNFTKSGGAGLSSVSDVLSSTRTLLEGLGFNVTPSIGDIVRLASADQFDNDAWAGAQYVPAAVGARRYTYIADASELVDGAIGDILGSGSSIGSADGDEDEFAPIDHRGYAPDTPYDVALLRRIDANARRLAQTRGPNCSISFIGTGTGATDYVKNRPLVSTRRWSSFLRIPWLVQPGELSIDTHITCRVSEGANDGSPGDSIGEGFALVQVRGYLMDRHGLGDLGAPVLGLSSGNNFVWRAERFSSSVRSDDLVGYVRDTFVVDLTCEPVTNTGFGTSLSETNMPPSDVQPWVELTTGTFYADDTAASSPQPTSNWITCTRIRNEASFFAGSDGTESYHDHVYASSNKKMMLVPRPNRDSDSEVAKLYVPYLQVRAVQVSSTFSREIGVDASGHLALQSPSGPALSGIASSINETHSRLQLCAAGLFSRTDETGSATAMWDRRYPFFAPYTIGAETPTYYTSGRCELSSPRFFALINIVCSHNVLGEVDLFRSATGSTDTLAELEKHVVDGLINVSVTISQGGTTAAFLQLTDIIAQYWPATILSESPFLQTEAVKIALAAGGGGLVLREGMMDLDLGEGPDAGLEIPLTLQLSVDSWDPSAPFDVSVALEQNASTPYPRWSQDADEQSLAVDIGQMCATITGFALWGQDA